MLAPYTPSAPPADLVRDLVLGWTARLGGRYRLVPDGCVDVLWIGNGTAWVCGPETSAWTFEMPPGTEAVGVRLRPGRAASALGLDTPGARDRRGPPRTGCASCRATSAAGWPTLLNRTGSARPSHARSPTTPRPAWPPWPRPRA